MKKRVEEEMQEWDEDEREREEAEMAERIRDARGCVGHDLLPSFSPEKKLITRTHTHIPIEKNKSL